MTSISDSIRQLARAQKTSRGISLYSRWVNRPVGRVLAALAHELRMTPNQVTLVSAVVTGAGLACLVAVSIRPLAGLVGGTLLIIGFALDSADGQLSRLTGQSSPAGEWLDHVVDAGKMVAVHTAVLITAWLHFSIADSWLVVPLLFQLVAIITYAGGTLMPLVRRPSSSQTTSAPSTVRSIILLPADYGVLCLVLATVGFASVFIWLYSALLAANVVIMAALLTRWFRQLGADPVA